MTRYTHFFDVRVPQQFDSDIEDFNQALQQWIASFSTDAELKKALLYTDDHVHYLIGGIVYDGETEEIDPEIGPSYDIWIAEPDKWEWCFDQRFTCEDDPDGKGARRSAHQYARSLRKTYHCAYVAVRPAGKAPLPVRPPLYDEPPFKDFSASWLGL